MTSYAIELNENQKELVRLMWKIKDAEIRQALQDLVDKLIETEAMVR